MNRVFADSFFFIALLSPRDSYHAQAMRLARELPSKIVTTRWVIVEVGNALSGLAARRSFGRFVTGLGDQDRVVVLPDSDALFDDGVRLFSTRPDKEWSLTDCISIEAMRSEGLSDVLTGDHHFSQAGFHTLMDSSA